MTAAQHEDKGPPVVIVGTGMAGYTVARELRKLDSTVPIVMISRDDGSFYSKPMLSNALAMKKEPQALASFDAMAMAAQLGAWIRVISAWSAFCRPSTRWWSTMRCSATASWCWPRARTLGA
jgi:Uncharacterized NAD(FAD)-dependent dehydrogenases